MTAVGELTLWVALFLALWASVASVVGGRLQRAELVTSSRRAMSVVAVLLVVAAAGLWQALLSHDFSLEYVASHTTLNTPTVYLFVALWAGPEGRLLFVALTVSLLGAMSVGRNGGSRLAATTTMVATLATLVAGLLVLVCFAANPYDRIEWVPAEGQGLDPQLQTPLAAVYFIAVYTGYAAASIVLALAVGAAITRQVGRAWSSAMRRWATLCWCLLTIAVSVRMRWGYLQPGSAGFKSAAAAQVITLAVWALSFAMVLFLRSRKHGDTPVTTRTIPGAASATIFGIGLLLIVTGVAASRSWVDQQLSLSPGGRAEFTDRYGGRWRFVSQGVSRDEQVNYLSTSVALEVWRGEERRGFVSAERRQYLDSVQRPTFEPVLRPGLLSSPTIDVYALFRGLTEDGANLEISFRPLVSMVWVGWMLVGGAGLALTLGPRPTKRSREPAQAG